MSHAAGTRCLIRLMNECMKKKKKKKMKRKKKGHWIKNGIKMVS